MPAEHDQGEDNVVMFGEYALELAGSLHVQPILQQLASGNSVPLAMYKEQWDDLFASLEA